MQEKNKISLDIRTSNKNSFKEAMDKVEHDFRTNTLEKTLERLGINPDCLSESFKEELKAQPEGAGTICPRAGVIIGTIGEVVGVGTTCPIGKTVGFVNGSQLTEEEAYELLTNREPDLNPENYRLTQEENDFLNSIEPPKDLF